jgi:hypothetical protein
MIQLPHPLRDFVRIPAVELENPIENDELIEAAVAVAEGDFILGPRDDFPLVREHLDRFHELADVAASPAGVPSQRAADRPRNTGENFKPRQLRLDTAGNELRERSRGRGPDSGAVDVDPLERLTSQLENDAADPFVAHKEIGASPQHAHRNLLLVADLDDLHELFRMTGFEEILSWSPHLQPGERSERLIPPRDFAEVGKRTHDAPDRYPQPPW